MHLLIWTGVLQHYINEFMCRLPDGRKVTRGIFLPLEQAGVYCWMGIYLLFPSLSLDVFNCLVHGIRIDFGWQPLASQNWCNICGNAVAVGVSQRWTGSNRLRG